MPDLRVYVKCAVLPDKSSLECLVSTVPGLRASGLIRAGADLNAMRERPFPAR
jgi:hypothetical protein